MIEFFSLVEINRVINLFRSKLSTMEFSSKFQKRRNESILLILKECTSDPISWDRYTPFNIQFISNALTDELNSQDINNERLDVIFSLCFRFFMEFHISNPKATPSMYESIKSFASQHLLDFTPESRSQIEYSFREMPVSLLQEILKGEDFDAIREFSSITEAAAELKKQWDNELNERLEKIKHIDAALKEQENAYNFAGLYKGFNDLSIKKQSEYKWSKLIMIALGLLIPLPIIVESMIFFKVGMVLSSSLDLIKLTPAISLTFIFIYFFRISLNNFDSVKAQIVQLELRKSLCQFIQNYAEYSREQKSKDYNPLEKFEEIIFSNIMINQDKIPSTYDGLEQVASLITSLKGK